MMGLTKERLMALSNRENVGAICSDEIVAMARQLLASMEQEPVAWRWFHLKQWHVTNDEARARNLAWDGVNVTPLYAAPQLPQPAVQNMHHDAKCDLFRPQVVNGVFVPRHCDCSAATLQGAEPISQPFTLREGLAEIRNLGPIDAEKIQAERDALNEPVQDWIPCSERMPIENDIVLVVDDGYLVCEAQYREGEFFSAVRGKGEFFETTCRDVEIWMPLPAAPQQEADNG